MYWQKKALWVAGVCKEDIVGFENREGENMNYARMSISFLGKLLVELKEQIMSMSIPNLRLYLFVQND